MPIYICDTVLNQMISSLSESVKKVYSTSDGVTQYPILIGAGNSGNTIASRISAMIGQTEGAGAVIFYPIEVGQKGGELRGIDPQKNCRAIGSYMRQHCEYRENTIATQGAI